MGNRILTPMSQEAASGGESTSTTPLDRGNWIAFAAILLGAAALRLSFVPILRNRQTHDIQIFISWAQLLMQYGSHHLYEHRDTIDHFPVNYPPLFSLLLAAVVGSYRLATHGTENLVLLGMLLKLPAIVADLVFCVLVFTIVRRWAGTRAALWAMTIAAYAPTTWPISALWGQVDSISTLFMVLALASAFSRRYTLAWSALALAVLVKPLPIVVAPLLFAAQLRDQGWVPRLVAGPVCALVIAYLVSLPFAPTAAPVGVMRWLVTEYTAGQTLSPWTSVNAYNLWALISQPTEVHHRYFWPPDSLQRLGLTLRAWGWLAFSAIIVPTTWALFRRLPGEDDRVAQEQLVTRAWFIVLVGLFLVATRMHERYILFALALAPLIWYCGRWDRGSTAALIVTFTICVTLVLGFYEHSWLPELLPVTRLLSVVNLFALGAAMVPYFMPGWTRHRGPPSATIASAAQERALKTAT